MRVTRFSDIASTKFEDYSAAFSMNDLAIKVTQVGENYDYLVRSYQSVYAELLKETSSLIREVCPTISFTSLSRLSGMLMDGKGRQVLGRKSSRARFCKVFPSPAAGGRR